MKIKWVTLKPGMIFEGKRDNRIIVRLNWVHDKEKTVGYRYIGKYPYHEGGNVISIKQLVRDYIFLEELV